ncbi:hypothetical protein FH972_022499 [Carpinus fangiana]|uniref:Sugar phosphate transporter domain-containing protein n=1 Tax=Carpinus fangiana TaxID=176857 RepID=A0A5N6KSR5_9ROSI|nr:hypothetical protein FH972_022499 [Carpinus fangiana]
MTSIFSNASSKAILTAFRFPVTLTVVQFAFVSSLCVFSSWLAHVYPPLKTLVPALKYSIRSPSKELILTTLPLTAFQIGGHILNSDAMSRIPVSLVHTIKGLSPLFTVLAYRLIFRIHYSIPTYLSLVPLTLGVVMACSANLSGDFVGLLFALGSALLFVTQNIVSKKLFNEAARAESEGVLPSEMRKKPDKLNLLCYSSFLAFLLTIPIWVGSEAVTLLQDLFNDGTIELAQRPDALDHGRLALEFVFNGVFHFAQSLVAFVLLSMVSPVTYSVASLIKRVFVITFAVVWFGNPLTTIQGLGIAMTFVGLYLYDRTKDTSRADRRAKMVLGRPDQPLLPLIAEDKKIESASRVPSPLSDGAGNAYSMVPGENGGVANGNWLKPGTKQEHTWKPSDLPQTSSPTAL